MITTRRSSWIAHGRRSSRLMWRRRSSGAGWTKTCIANTGSGRLRWSHPVVGWTMMRWIVEMRHRRCWCYTKFIWKIFLIFGNLPMHFLQIRRKHGTSVDCSCSHRTVDEVLWVEFLWRNQSNVWWHSEVLMDHQWWLNNVFNSFYRFIVKLTADTITRKGTTFLEDLEATLGGLSQLLDFSTTTTNDRTGMRLVDQHFGIDFAAAGFFPLKLDI